MNDASEFYAKTRRRAQQRRAVRGMTEEEWCERRKAMARARARAQRERYRGQGLSVNPVRDACIEAPYPRGFELDRGAFLVAFLGFWGAS